MVDYNAPLFQNPQQTWDAAKCAKLVKRIKRDGLGTAHSLKGMLYNGEIGGHNGELQVRYNGGCVKGEGANEEWYQGEQWELPILADGFEIVYVSTWGWRIVKTEKAGVDSPR